MRPSKACCRCRNEFNDNIFVVDMIGLLKKYKNAYLHEAEVDLRFICKECYENLITELKKTED